MLNNLSEMPVPNIAQRLAQAFQILSQRTGASVLAPSILIPQKDLSSHGRIEERVLAWFRKQGFDGERDSKSPPDFLPQFGYPRLFEDLIDMPDQVHRERQLERNRQLLVEQIKPGNDFEQEGLKKMWDEMQCQSERLPHLHQVLGSTELIENLHTAIIHDDLDGYSRCMVAYGAPDLFLWHPDVDLRLWFFAEVKGPGDSLRETQSIWLQENWEQIQGRFVLVHVL